MNYIIQQTDGEFEIAQMTPVVIGRFPDQAIAVRVLELLASDVNAELTPETAIKPPARVVETPPEPDAPVVVKPVAAKPAPPKPAPQKVSLASANPLGWDKDELDVAFKRLEHGEKLRVVADDFGKSWTGLRGQWAEHNRAHVKKASEEQAENLPATISDPVKTAVAAIGELNEQPNCIICTRPFTMTPDRIDRCARCSDDAT